MPRLTLSPDAPEGVARRAGELFAGHRLSILQRTDRQFTVLLAFEWLASLTVAALISPQTWSGAASQTHVHVWAALFLGGATVSLPIAFALRRPGTIATRHVIAVGQMLMGGLLIHLTGGRIETHFHIFGSLALLAFYRDWRVLITASAVVALYHLLGDYYWPRSIYGAFEVEPWRWVEHTGWVAFEDLFLVRACREGMREMWDSGVRQAEVEVTREGVEQTVRRRTAELEAEISERGRVEVALRESEARFRSLCACSPVGIFTTDTDGLCTYVNPRSRAIAGFTQEEALGNGWQRFLYPEDRDRVLESWYTACRLEREFEAVYRYGTATDNSRWVHGRASPMLDAQGAFIGHAGTIEDMTEWKRSEERLAHQATHDALTGLPNRALLQRELERSVEASARDGTVTFALLMIDLDRFKEINDTFGHHHGDSVLQQLNPRLRKSLRKTDLIARIGGDEFAALLPGADETDAVMVAERMLASLKVPIGVEGHDLEVGASIGIALYPDQGKDAAALMRNADVAMYSAKRAHGGYALYSPDQSAQSPRRLSLVSELRQAIASDQLLLHYQPKVDLRTLRVTSAEALVRWAHPRDGMIPPGQFIPLAEQTGLIKPLGMWVLRQALTQCRAWHRGGYNLNIAINLAPDNLRDEKLLATVVDFLGQSDALPSWLTLEITESAMMADPARARTVLNELHELGVKISIDDFGTGYSSLAYLKTLPVDEVKIDRCFVKDMIALEKDSCIVRAVIDLGHNLGLRVVAEGVEDRASLDLLAAWGCDSAQGFYYSRPLPAAPFLDWVCQFPAFPAEPARLSLTHQKARQAGATASP